MSDPSPQRPPALFQVEPEDFVVDEIDAYPTTGEGEHTFVRIRKRDLGTEQAVERIASALRIDRRACSWAGLKDRRAIATQRISLPGVAPEAVMELRWPDLEVLEAARHRNKLRPGHLHGNRFSIRLRDVVVTPEALATLDRIGREGFPNAYGPQRFGRDGDNDVRALSFVRGETRPPREPHLRRLLFSALQARWFNRVLEERVADGTWKTALLGDLLERHETGGLFVCDDEARDRARAEARELSPTGPMFGHSMKKPGPEVLARELAVLERDGLTLESLTPWKALGEGSRRLMRELVEDLKVSVEPQNSIPAPDAPATAQPPAVDVVVQFTLGKGVYATTILEQVFSLQRPRMGATEGTPATSSVRGHRRAGLMAELTADSGETSG